MDLIPGQRSPRKGCGSAGCHLRAALFGGEYRLCRQQSQSAQGTGRAALTALGIRQCIAQHLIPTADPQHGRTAGRQLLQGSLQAGLAQPKQILHRIFGAGQQHQIGCAQLPHGAQIAHTQQRVLLQRDKIGKIGDMRQPHDCHIQRLYGLFAAKPFGEGVLVLDVRIQIRHNAQHRQPGFILQHGKAGAQNFNITTEFIDDKPFDAALLPFLKQRNRTVQLGKHPAAVDVPRQQHRRIDQLCQAHIDNVIRFQVDLGWAACALDDKKVIFLGKAVVGTQYIGDQRALMAEVFCCRHIPAHLTVDNNLTADIAAGLEQNRVHPHIGFNARCLRLHDLRTAHLETISGHKAVQRHILAFERRRFVAILRQNPAECRTEQAFACTAHCSLHHDTFCPAHASTSFMMASSLVFSSAVRTAVRYQPSSRPG